MFEVRLDDLDASKGVRVGWSTKEASLDEPVGSDENGYGFVVNTGESVHKRCKRKYSSTVSKGGVIGCLIHIPVPGRPFEPTPQGVSRVFWLS